MVGPSANTIPKLTLDLPSPKVTAEALKRPPPIIFNLPIPTGEPTMEDKPAAKPPLNFNLPPPTPKPAETTPVSSAPKFNLAPPNPNAPVRPQGPVEAPKFNLAPPTPKPKSRIEILMEDAYDLDPVVSSDQWFKSKLEACADMPPPQWISWAEGALQDVQAMTSDQADLIKRYNMIDAGKWIEEAIAASNKKRSFLDRFTGEKPEYYEAIFNKTRIELQTVHTDLSNIAAQLPIVADRLRTDAVIIQVVSAKVTDPVHATTGTNRMKTLLAATQTVAMVKTSLDNALNSIVKQINDIDHLQMNVIPAWKLVVAQQK